jgi:hypothetical protein
MVTEAAAMALGSALLRARTATGFVAGTLSGAVYTASWVLPGAATIVPTAALPPVMPLTSQLTLVSDAPLTVPVKFMVLPGATVAAVGEIVILTTVLAVVMLIVAVADLVGSAMLVAVSNTKSGEGRVCGAVKTPAEFTVPQALPKQPTPAIFQITAVTGLPAEITLA